jgi:hypothetical protein
MIDQNSFEIGLEDNQVENRIFNPSRALMVKLQQKVVFNGHEFKLFFIYNNKQKAKRKAAQFHRHGFHTRVIETFPGWFAVYR